MKMNKIYLFLIITGVILCSIGVVFNNHIIGDVGFCISFFSYIHWLYSGEEDVDNG